MLGNTQAYAQSRVETVANDSEPKDESAEATAGSGLQTQDNDLQVFSDALV
jgi:hypothetical protein